MIKRTLYFGNPAYLKTKTEQLVIEIPDTDESKSVLNLPGFENLAGLTVN